MSTITAAFSLIAALGEWSLSFCMDQTPQDGLLNHRLLGPTPKVRFRRSGMEPENLHV